MPIPSPPCPASLSNEGQNAWEKRPQPRPSIPKNNLYYVILASKDPMLGVCSGEAVAQEPCYVINDLVKLSGVVGLIPSDETPTNPDLVGSQLVAAPRGFPKPGTYLKSLPGFARVSSLLSSPLSLLPLVGTSIEDASRLLVLSRITPQTKTLQDAVVKWISNVYIADWIAIICRQLAPST
ncbi:hypothetical protein NE237_028024 [Protea cynaroides]|uniref:Uncharacterized protein n=1 Tax=Protea cynaroides TaxID=273540 RepID=A0A9Q0GSG4_9MAGN|nr:hypothetical protein NE237_028024 [Protea cynaroides]